MSRRSIGALGVMSFALFSLVTLLVLLLPDALWLSTGWPGQGVSDLLFVHATQHPWLADNARALSDLGGDVIASVIVILVAVLLVAARRRALAAYVCLSALGSVIAVSIVKDVVDRERPGTLGVLADASSAAYPSGHSSAGVAVFGALGAVAWILWPTWWGRSVAVLLGVLGLAIAGSRLVLGVHWTTDVLGGLLLGLSVTCAAGWAVIAVTESQRGSPAREPHAPEQDSARTT